MRFGKQFIGVKCPLSLRWHAFIVVFLRRVIIIIWAMLLNIGLMLFLSAQSATVGQIEIAAPKELMKDSTHIVQVITA